MNTITFDCEIITPMFMAGADGKTPELRAPSIKGVLRFWWRAIHGDLDIKDLRTYEATIFGGSGKEQGRSKVVIKVKNAPVYDGRYKYPPVPHKNNFFQKAFKPATTFTLILSLTTDKIEFKNGEKFDIETLKNLFILTSILGGFGKRSRRGFGSIRIKKINNQTFTMPENLGDIYKILEKIIPGKYKNESSKIVLNFEPKINYPYIRSIEIKSVDDTHDTSFEKVLGKISEVSSKTYDKSLGFVDGNERQASPIYVSIIKTLDEKYIPIVTTLNSAFKNPSHVNFEKQKCFKEAVLL